MIPSTGRPGPAGPPDYFMGFIVAASVVGILVSGIYLLVCIGGLRFFGHQRDVKTVVAGVIGLLFAGGGLVSQFIPGLAPTGDALWGRHLGVVIAALMLLIILARFRTPASAGPAVAEAAESTGSLE